MQSTTDILLNNNKRYTTMNRVEVIMLICSTIMSIVGSVWIFVKKIKPKLIAQHEKKMGILNAVKIKDTIARTCPCGCGIICDPEIDVLEGGQWWRRECYKKLLEN